MCLLHLKQKRKNSRIASSLVVFDAKEIILEEGQNPDLWFSSSFALNNKWYKHIPESDSRGMINLNEGISSEAYSRANDKSIRLLIHQKDDYSCHLHVGLTNWE